MPIIRTKIELNIKDILQLVVEKYGLNPEKSTIAVYTEKDDRGISSDITTIYVEGEQITKKVGRTFD